jgi:hypothetical protein
MPFIKVSDLTLELIEGAARAAAAGNDDDAKLKTWQAAECQSYVANLRLPPEMIGLLFDLLWAALRAQRAADRGNAYAADQDSTYASDRGDAP